MAGHALTTPDWLFEMKKTSRCRGIRESSMYTHPHTRKHAHTHTHSHAHAHTRTLTHTRKHAHTHAHARTRADGNNLGVGEVDKHSLDRLRQVHLGVDFDKLILLQLLRSPTRQVIYSLRP